MFTEKYPTFKYNDYDLGYFIHLYTDKIWFEEFTPNVRFNNSIKMLDGTVLKLSEEEQSKLIYSDYTNINTQIIDLHDMDLSLFYEEFNTPTTSIEEVPIDKIDILINKMGIIIENSKEEKPYVFDIYPVEEFINKSVKKIKEVLKEY